MNIKLLIIMLLLLVPFGLANLDYSFTTAEYMIPYEANFISVFIPYLKEFMADEPVKFYFGLNLNGNFAQTPESSGIPLENYLYWNEYPYGTPLNYISESVQTIALPFTSVGVLDSRDVSQVRENVELPYYISSCHISCDIDNPNYDFSYYPTNTEYAYNMELNYECPYTQEELTLKTNLNESIYMSIYCQLETNPVYTKKGGYIDPIEFFEYNRYLIDDRERNLEFGWTCKENPIEKETSFLDSGARLWEDNDGGCELYFLELIQLNFTIPDNPVQFDFGNLTHSFELQDIGYIDLSHISDEIKNKVGKEQENSGGEKTPDKITQGQDQKQKEKQRQYEQQLRIVEKKNSFLNNLVEICIILFSIMLLSYYLVSIAVLGYLLSILFPRIMSIPYTIIQEFRQNKGGKQ